MDPGAALGVCYCSEEPRVAAMISRVFVGPKTSSHEDPRPPSFVCGCVAGCVRRPCASTRASLRAGLWFQPASPCLLLPVVCLLEPRVILGLCFGLWPWNWNRSS